MSHNENSISCDKTEEKKNTNAEIYEISIAKKNWLEYIKLNWVRTTKNINYFSN